MRQARNPSSVDKLRMQEMSVFKRTIPGKSPARRIAAERCQQYKKSKIMKRLIIILIFFSLIVSCQPSESEPYYNFSNLDYEFIPEQYQEIGRTFIFKNAQNEEVKIKPLFYTLNKEFESGYGFGQPTQTESYYYDDLWIEIDLLNVEIPDEPDGYCERIYIHINKSPYKGLFVDLQIPSYNEPFCSGGGFNEFSPFEGLTQMIINNKTY